MSASPSWHTYDGEGGFSMSRGPHWVLASPLPGQTPFLPVYAVFPGQQVCWYGSYRCPFWPGTQSHAPYITKHTLICKHTTCSRSSSAAVLSGTVQTRVASKCAYVMCCSSLNSCVELHHLPYYQWSRKLLLHLQLQVGPIGPWFEIPTESVNE